MTQVKKKVSEHILCNIFYFQKKYNNIHILIDIHVRVSEYSMMHM